MTKMEITSDVKGKLQKIRNGTVFDSPLIFISELFQNSLRAKAKNVNITVKNGQFIFYDDGVGSRTPKPILTLDYSEWESTDEGFGIGFWSILAIPNLQSTVVASKKWKATIDVNQLFESGVPEATIEHLDEPFSGFLVGLVSPYIAEFEYRIITEVKKVGGLQMFNVYLNNQPVEKINILADANGDFIKDFSTRQFTARFTITDNYGPIKLFYERRELGGIYKDGIGGIIELKKNGVTLKEPDRKSIIRDDKYDDFERKIRECREEMYKEFIKQANDDLIDKYSSKIDDVLYVEDYENHIKIPDFGLNVAENNEDTDFDSIESHGGCASIHDGISRSEYTLPNYSQENSIVDGSAAKIAYRRPRKITLKHEVKRVSKKCWMRSKESEDMTELKAKAEYYGVKVFVAKNILHERIFFKYRVPHISELDEGVTKIDEIKDVEIRNGKEEIFIRSLLPICKFYNLPDNTFKIGKCGLLVVTKLDGKILDRERKRVEGVCSGEDIILDRRSLGLKRFFLYGEREKIGRNELLAVMANMGTIAHELAHRLYRTTDNTVQHYQMMEKILGDVGKIYGV